MTFLLQGTLSFIFIFLKGLQQQNVIGGKYTAAFMVSAIMSITEVLIITTIVVRGWQSAIPISVGAAFGIISSMYVYRNIPRIYKHFGWDKK